MTTTVMAQAGPNTGGPPTPPSGGRRPPPPPPRLPAGPLVDAVARAGGLPALMPAPRQRDRRDRRLARAYHAANHTGTVTAHAADRLAVELLGVHPAVIYGTDWTHA